jgi:alkaline phosphatase
VSRADYQDLARDLLGLASVSHPDRPLRGMNVVIGCGHGVERSQDATQGRNFVSGNRYVTEEDLARVDAERGGRYVVARRRAGQKGGKALAAAAARAARTGLRLLGLYGVEGGHLPYRTANGDYRPVRGADVLAEAYTGADLEENPTLPEMTAAALTVLETNPRGFWLMVEPGDVDWANHDANLDDSIGSVLDGDDAVHVVTDWIESHGGWNEALLIVTADHAHYLVLENPSGLVTPPR